MPYSVERLIQNQANVATVHKNDTITDALDLMIGHDYSQLPVVDEENRLLGMVTYQSIMRATRSFNTKLDQLLVRDATVNTSYHYREDDLFDLLDELKDANAVAIIEPAGLLIGIVTSYDASDFLRNRTEDLMHVEDIEFMIKELIKKAHGSTKGKANNERLQESAALPDAQQTKQLGSRKAKDFEDLSLADYINLLMSKEVWSFCAPILNIQKESLYELLEKVRYTRNDLAHFRREISARSRDELKYCASWLRRRYQDYEKEQESIFINDLLKQPREITHAVKEELTAYKSITKNPKTSQEGKTYSRSRYSELADWLAQQKEDQVSLTFEQIEEIICSTLPYSALVLRAWWANDRAGYNHSILWLEAGWKVIYVDLSEMQVIFARINANESP